MNALKFILALLGSMAPLMYFHGQAYHQGRLDYWSLPFDLFPLSLEQTLVYGYFAYTPLGITYLALLLILLVVVIGILLNIHELSKFRWFRNKIDGWLTSTVKPSSGHELTGTALNASVKTAGVVLAVLLILIVVIYIFGEVETLGFEQERKAHLDKAHQGIKASIQFEDGTSVQGVPVMCSDAMCAFLINDQVQLVSRDKVFKISWRAPAVPN